jgi:competence protein ComEC
MTNLEIKISNGMRDKVFYAICFGFLAGVLVRSFWLIDFSLTLLLGIISIILIIYFLFFSKNKRSPSGKFWLFISFFLLSFSFGLVRFEMADKIPELPVDSLTGQIVGLGAKANFSGKIIDEPEKKENSQRLTVLLDQTKNLKILLTTGQDEKYHYGDHLHFSGALIKPDNFITDQGKEFDYVNYLRKDGIFYLSVYPKIEVMGHGEGNIIKSALFSLKEKFLEKINTEIPEPESLLMNGLILGERSAFSNEFRQAFINTGTIHIIALSGYNVTIVAEWIMKVFMVLLAPLSRSGMEPQNLGIGMGIFAILLFILMTGASSTAIRAGIMATLALVARATGRNYDVLRALVLAGVIMVLINPLVLAYDVSFELSFIATIAVIFLAPRIEKYFWWVTPKFKLRDIVSVTSAAYLFVLPFILYKMGNLSLTALPANILILPFIPATMLFGFLAGITGLIWYYLSVPFALISKIFLTYELWVINFLSNLSYSSFIVPNFPLTITLAIYGYFIYRLFGRELKKFFTFQ